MKQPDRRAHKQISPAKAVTCVVINLCATPGLGSLIAGRVQAGILQLSIAVIGFGLIVWWIACFAWDRIRVATGDEPLRTPYGWAGKWGVILFAVAWFWALLTSLSILRQAKTGQSATNTQPPPVCTSGAKHSEQG
jgi:hypothetical protein